MIRKATSRIRENVRGGKGNIEFIDIISKEEFDKHGSLFAKLVLPPGSSIGRHEHVEETEPYYILKGKGLFEDHDGSRTEVGPGDVCLIGFGESHAIENIGDEDLELIALIYNE